MWFLKLLKQWRQFLYFTFPNTSNFLKNTPLRVALSFSSSVFTNKTRKPLVFDHDIWYYYLTSYPPVSSLLCFFHKDNNSLGPRWISCFHKISSKRQTHSFISLERNLYERNQLNCWQNDVMWRYGHHSCVLVFELI